MDFAVHSQSYHSGMIQTQTEAEHIPVELTPERGSVTAADIGIFGEFLLNVEGSADAQTFEIFFLFFVEINGLFQINKAFNPTKTNADSARMPPTLITPKTVIPAPIKV